MQKIKNKNMDCNPAKGTVAFFNDGFATKNTNNEKTRENENRIINVLIGKLTAIIIKKSISPNPKAFDKLVFNFNFAYP